MASSAADSPTRQLTNSLEVLLDRLIQHENGCRRACPEQSRRVSRLRPGIARTSTHEVPQSETCSPEFDFPHERGRLRAAPGLFTSPESPSQNRSASPSLPAGSTRATRLSSIPSSRKRHTACRNLKLALRPPQPGREDREHRKSRNRLQRRHWLRFRQINPIGNRLGGIKARDSA